MPRIRTIKPEFFSDEKLAPLAPIDRLVFLGLISMADDAGRLIDNAKVIDAYIFPMSDDQSGTSLRRLADLSRIVRYEAANGQKLIQITNWHHQKVEKPNPRVLPAPTADSAPQVSNTSRVTRFPDESGNNRGTVADSSPTNHPLDLGSRILDQGPTTNDPPREPVAVAGPVQLVVAANQGMRDNPAIGAGRELLHPIRHTHPGSVQAAADLLRDVDLEFARSAIYDAAKAFVPSPADERVRSLAYFVPGVRRLWSEKQAADMASGAARPVALAPRVNTHAPRGSATATLSTIRGAIPRGIAGGES